MSGGKKKSGFQITSVTSDYEQQQQREREREGLASPPGLDTKAPSSPRVVVRASGAPGEEEEEEVEVGVVGAGVVKRAEGVAPPNGPQGPGPVGASAAASAASRFRVVKLDQSSGEPFKRGRWTCRDSYEPEAEAHLLAGRLADLGRHPHSLDSRLEATGLLLPKPPAAGPFSPQLPRRGTAPHGPLLLLLPPPPGPSAGHQARSLGGGGGLPALLRPHQIPPNAGALRSPLAAPGGDPGPSAAVPVLVVDEPPPGLPRSVAQLIQREAAEEPRHKVVSSSSSPRQPRSRPSSPAPPPFRDASPSPSRKTSDPFGAARLSLAQSMFGMGVGAQDCDGDSGTNSSMIAIDNKIEQAMDLVKSHLMFAVREEVEVLREQIKELSERNALLEQENALLRSLANADQLSCFQAQLHTAKPSSSGSSD